MLEAKNISVIRQGRHLLNNISVSLLPGKLNLIIGPNGAGKSTLLRVLSGQLAPDQGEAWIEGQPVSSYSFESLARFRAVLSQRIEITFPMLAREVVMMGRYPHFHVKPSLEDEEAVDQAMKLFEVSDLASRNFLTLSGGEMQRVNFARVLAQLWYPTNGRNRYLLLDEPLTFLDIHYQFNFLLRLRELLTQSGWVMVGVVHDLNLVARFADHVVLLADGKVMAKGDRKEVLTAHNIRAAFRIEPAIHHDDETGSPYMIFK